MAKLEARKVASCHSVALYREWSGICYACSKIPSLLYTHGYGAVAQEYNLEVMSRVPTALSVRQVSFFCAWKVLTSCPCGCQPRFDDFFIATRILHVKATRQVAWMPTFTPYRTPACVHSSKPCTETLIATRTQVIRLSTLTRWFRSISMLCAGALHTHTRIRQRHQQRLFLTD